MSSGDKLLSVLTLFSTERAVLTVEQAAQEFGLSTSTSYRYFASLAKAGLIDQPGEGRYIPGPAAIEMDWLIRRTDPLTLACGPAWRQLAVGLDRPVVLLLCRLYRGQVMCVMQDRVGFPQFGSGHERTAHGAIQGRRVEDHPGPADGARNQRTFQAAGKL